jgi:hypothetical protein
MIPRSDPVHAAEIQEDVRRAFLMRKRRVFERANRQIYAIVGSNPDMGVVSETWFGDYESSHEFRDVLVHVLDLVKREGLRFWLIDLRFKVPDFRRELEWIEGALLPAAIAAGVERGAAVLPEAAAVKDGQDLSETLFNLLGKAGGGRMRGFKDIDLAKQWLLEGELPPAS